MDWAASLFVSGQLYAAADLYYSMDILVTGGTGFIGGHLCAELVEQGHDVTALARNPTGADVPDGVDTAMGDVSAYDSIIGAFEGRDVVVNLVALSPLFQPAGGNEMHDKVHRQGTVNCLDAAEEQGVDRFIQLSALGAHPDGDTHYIRAKGRADEAVKSSSLDWTIFQPSVVFGEGDEFLGFTRTLTPPVLAPLPGGGSTRFQPLFVGDFVEMLADSLEDDRHIGEIYEVGGPEVLTLAEVATLVREARGQSVRILPIPMSLAGIGLKVAGTIPGFPMGADQYRSLQFDNTTTSNDIDAFGKSTAELTTLATYLGVDD